MSRVKTEYEIPPIPEVTRYVGLHFLLGAVSGALASAVLGARNKELGADFIAGGLGGILPDIDQPIDGGRTFGHGTPAKVFGGVAIVTGAGISLKSEKKQAGRAITAFGTGWSSHQIADYYNWGI